VSAQLGVEAIGANGPPADLIPDDCSLTPRNVLIASRALGVICKALGGGLEPELALMKKAGGEHMHVRNLWLYALSTHIPRSEISTIARLNPKTITLYRKQMDEWGERNGLLRGFYDMIADMIEPIPGLVDDATEALADMAVEAALDRIRKSVDGLAR